MSARLKFPQSTIRFALLATALSAVIHLPSAAQCQQEIGAKITEQSAEEPQTEETQQQRPVAVDLSDLLPESWPRAKRTAPTMKRGEATLPAETQPAESKSHQRSATDSARLPWEMNAESVTAGGIHPPASALEILERFDVGPSRMEAFSDGQPWSAEQEETLNRILYRYPGFGLDNLLRWRETKVDWNAVVSSPEKFRGHIFQIRGQAVRVERETLNAQLAERFEFEHYYRVEIKLADSPNHADVFARQVPDVWKLDSPLDEPVTVDAMFLKVGEGAGALALLYFAAGRVAWFPQKLDSLHNFGPDQLKLTKRGFDWGLFDEKFRAGNGRPMGDADREAFYQLLDIVGRENPNQLLAVGSEPLAVVPLLAKPTERHGDIVLVKGIARRIVKVLVEDPDIQARFGIDHYYEIDMFLPLGKTTVRMGKDSTGELNPVYNNAFPATLIVRELPPGVVEGENISEHLETAAIFFKVWSYRSAYTEKFNKLQPAPMFIAQRPTPYREIRAANWITDALVGAALGGAALVLILVLWFFQRTDRSHRKPDQAGFPAPSATPSDSADFGKFKIEDKPDFSHLK
jgi:hypothetical protein